MRRRFWLLPLAAVLCFAPSVSGQERAFTFHRVLDGIYLAVGTGPVAVGCNGAVIVNERDVLIIDSHISPVAAEALLAELREITDKPVRYVVNTHFHFDHLHGNQSFPEDVEILGHEFTREMVLAGRSQSGRAYDRFIRSIPQNTEQMRSQLAGLEGEERAELAGRIDWLDGLYQADQLVRPTPPSVTLERAMTLHRGGREIRLLFFGRGHTGGDVVVHLPAERVLVTGDLLTEGVPYMGDAHLDEWVETLAQVESLDFDVVLPGHGSVFAGKEKISHLQAYLRELWQKAGELHRAGVPAAQAAARIDMRSHAEHYPTVTEIGVSPDAVARVYELLDAEP